MSEENAITVDVNIVLIGTEVSDIPCMAYHRSLLDAFHAIVQIAMDRQGHIKQLYEQKMGSASPGRRWLARLATKDRIRYYDLPMMPKPVKVKLQELHFDTDDHKFIRLALATTSRRLVTQDPDFSPAICKMLKKMERLEVCNAESACIHFSIPFE